MHQKIPSTGWDYKDILFGGNPLPSCDTFLRQYLNEFDANQKLSWSDKMRADNDTWRKFNNVAAHLFGIDSGRETKFYRQQIRHWYVEPEWIKYENRCERRVRDELREVAPASKPTSS